MRLTSALNHVEFGSLGVYMRGLTYFRISPYHLKTFGDIGQRMKSVFGRTVEAAIYTVPPAVAAYFVYIETEKKFDRMCRKNPADYENDK